MQGLAESVQGIAAWLQSVSAMVPVSQLSIITWVMVMVSGSLASGASFNRPERWP